MASAHFLWLLAFFMVWSFSGFDSAIGARSLSEASEPVEQSLFLLKHKPIFKPKFKLPFVPPKIFKKPFVKPIPYKHKFPVFPKFKIPPKFKLPPTEESQFKPIPGEHKFPEVKTFPKFEFPPKFKIPEKKFPPKFELPPKVKFPPLDHQLSENKEQTLSTSSPKSSGSVEQSLPLSSIPPIPGIPIELPNLPVIPGAIPDIIPPLPDSSSATRTKSGAP
ncbi:hypothetical protein Nepgr_019743 [Nepenthes gracilis]|uniref:Uncharacterized protein n=1 Tax=Nepenthes gracilis TaxID=150966 RepID=A0AAD3SVK9_NEPGR|nr:hypothetical protein Nepgr_019743 [Nepenthes gracilis]